MGTGGSCSADLSVNLVPELGSLNIDGQIAR